MCCTVGTGSGRTYELVPRPVLAEAVPVHVLLCVQTAARANSVSDAGHQRNLLGLRRTHVSMHIIVRMRAGHVCSRVPCMLLMAHPLALVLL